MVCAPGMNRFALTSLTGLRKGIFRQDLQDEQDFSLFSPA
jgi:hypothetical protein